MSAYAKLNFLNKVFIPISSNQIKSDKNSEDDKINVKLHYYICTHISGSIILTEHEDYAWVEKKDFHKYDFAEGDRDILSLL